MSSNTLIIRTAKSIQNISRVSSTTTAAAAAAADNDHLTRAPAKGQQRITGERLECDRHHGDENPWVIGIVVLQNVIRNVSEVGK